MSQSPRSKIILASLVCAPMGCVPRSVATASEVTVPVLVGPVDRIGGVASAPCTSGEFDVTIDRGVMVAGSPEGTTETRTIRETESKVDAAVREATNGDGRRPVHVDEVRVRAFSGYLFTGGWVHSRVRLRGGVGQALSPMNEDGAH